MKGKVGRPSRGDRHTSTLRLPRPLYQRVKDDADAAGISIVDFLNGIVMAHYGIDPKDPYAGIGQQQELDMTA